MKIRFAVLTLISDYEVYGSWLIHDGDAEHKVRDQSLHDSEEGHVEFFTLDTDTLVVERVPKRED